MLLSDWRAGLRHYDGEMQLIEITRVLDKEEVKKRRDSDGCSDRFSRSCSTRLSDCDIDCDTSVTYLVFLTRIAT